ncbi:archeo-eukaryotice exosomal RNAse PH [Cryptosporidium sp. chipmunk genotype I]|uniref:archeo-eukaryotice exosomal RNAse PH n=1 Tax=Cryptosporidium sp. chipmunk genotype I TaxID=1280935 RepID=UPI00351A617C|nr:archeo-eukaryotice exosomal RNAse PH [Cryptosporidium sp. chipmunk genotype I]
MVVFDSFPPLPPISESKNLLKDCDSLTLKKEDPGKFNIIPENKVLIRNDDRQFEELRPITIRTGVIENADGSAYFSIGNTKVLCGIYGPNLCKQNPIEDGLSVSVEYTIGSFCRDSALAKSKLNTDNTEIKSDEKIKSILLEKVINSVICHEKYKRSSIDCYFYIIDDDGSAFSAAISAACLSLCNAKIEIIGLFSATNIIAVKSNSLFNKDGKTHTDDEYSMILDPTFNEISCLGANKYSTLEIGLCTIRNQVVYLSANGDFFNDPIRIEEGFSLAEASCSAIVDEIKYHLTSEFNKNCNET